MPTHNKDVKGYYREAVPVPLFTQLPRRVLLGNPYTALPIVVREERGKGPLRALIGFEGTTPSRVG
jgi:hypothetical protein